MDKILISGASGFVGGHLIEALEKGDNDQIVALFHETIPNDSRKIKPSALHWVQKDIASRQTLVEFWEDPLALSLALPIGPFQFPFVESMQ